MEEIAVSEEPLIAKLTQNLQAAQDSLRMLLVAKVEELAAHPRALGGEELREELEGLVEEFLSQFAATYAEFISTVEEGLPARKVAKPRKKAAKKEAEQPEKPAFVKPTFVQRAFNAEDLRVAKEARPALMEALNEAIQHDIEKGPRFFKPIGEPEIFIEDENPSDEIYKIAVAILEERQSDQTQWVWLTYWFYDRPRQKWPFGGQNSLMLPKEEMKDFLNRVLEKWYK